MKAILASNNPHKLEEMHSILLPYGIELFGLKEMGFELDVEETGTSFEENSLIKAHALASLTDSVVIADDSGLCVDVLSGAPGVYSARYGAPNCKSDTDRNEMLLKQLKDIPMSKRNARFVCVITVLFPGEKPLVARGECEGLIAEQPSGRYGFGYDPIFYLPEYQKTMAELDSSIKNQISHRAAALQCMQCLLSERNHYVNQ